MDKITQITFIELGDSQFKVSFLFKSYNLETGSLPRTSSKEEVISAIKQVVADWKERRAENNYQSLKAALEGKEI